MVEVLQAENAELKAENHRLSLRVKALESELYGSRADRRQPEPDQRQETFAGMDEAVETAPPPAPKQATAARKGKTAPKGPKPLNPNLPRVHESIHQPYHRQGKQLQRHGVSLAANTMCSLVGLACEKLEPVYEQIKRDTLSHSYLMMNPTPVPLMTKTKRGSTREACLWTYRALHGPIFFEFTEGKHGHTPAKTLKLYNGILQTDGASNFGGVPAREDIVHLNCWAHLRRYFVKTEQSGDKRATEYLDAIDRLFRRERMIRRYKLGPRDTLELRRRYSLPEIDKLFERARQFAASERMLKLPMPKAVGYLLARTGPLRECFLHAPSRIDNNLAENALRPIKLGARNWLFIGSPNAGPRAAMMFTLVENCRILGINPEAYLIDVLTRVDSHLQKHIRDLTPHGWKKSKNA